MRLFLKIYTSAVLMLLSGVSALMAEPLEFIYEHYSSDDGLPHNSISDIHQDRRGYLWLCTWYGLSRFDGNSFVNYTMQPGDHSNLSHNRFQAIEEDASGYLWVLTYDYHLYRFDMDSEEFVAVPGELDHFSDSDVHVNDIHCARNGDVWISLSGIGLLQVAPDLTYRTYFSLNEDPVGKDVSHIFEDSSGNVYAVSETGVTMFRNGDASLLSRETGVFSFCEIGNDLFFASPEELLAVDKETREQRKAVLSDAGSLATSMTSTGPCNDRLVIGFKDNAVGTVDVSTLEVTVLKNDMGRVCRLFPDPGNLVWIVTDRTGIWSYNIETERFRHYEHAKNAMSYYSDPNALVKTRGGRTWIKMTNWGFGYYDRDADAIVPLSNVKEEPESRFMNGVPCFHIDNSGVLWMSTVARGLERVTVINPKVDIVVPPAVSADNLSSSEVRAMLRDSKNRIWVATKSEELFRYSPDLSHCRRFPDGTIGDIGVIYSIFEDRDSNIWLGTKGDGLYKMTPDGDDYRWSHFEADGSKGSLSSNDIYSIEQDNDGRIWVGTYGGGLSMLPTSESEDFITVANSFPDYPKETGDRVRYLHCMQDGKMLVATVGGLIWFEPSDTPEITVFNLVRKVKGDIHSLGNNDVMHIFTARDGETWLSTFGGGLNRLYFENGVPRFDVISTADGLVSNIVHSAADDADGNIWIATQSNISRLDPHTGNIINYTRYDGVPPVANSEATCAVMADGNVLFGTLNNIYRIDPQDFEGDHRDYDLAFTGLRIDGERTPFKGDIVIPHDFSFFRIDFASLDFSVNPKVNCMYRLDGYDKKWISDDGGNRATYSRIPPGRYVFEVAPVGDVTHPDEVISIKVRVKPSVWNSAFSVALYIVIALLLLFILIRALLTSMKLRSDVRLEQDLNDIKARFFTNISHELRTPLTLILGGIDEISNKIKPGDINEYSVNLVSKNARRMMTLVNQLLDIRTIVSGKMRLKVSQFDIVKLVCDVYDDFRDMSSERQMEMRIVKSVDSLLVWGDTIRLEALVYNLMSNAFKYTPDGGKIEVGVLYREGDQEFRIMVKDNGIGVPKEKQDIIFEPFMKGSAKAFKDMASSGIGLSFCREIADIHGGEIWVESRKNEGSKFFVRLPISRDRFSGTDVQFVDDAVTEAQPEVFGLSKYKVPATYPQGAMKVLVVEDNAELRVHIYNCLINHYEVRDASDGQEALNVIESGWIPDMIVTDLMMPRMNGIQLVNHIRNDFATSHIPVVMITAKHEDDTQVKAMKYGADGYMTKPFSMELLMARIENLLERRRALMSLYSSASEDSKKPSPVSIVPEEIVITDRDEQLIKKVMRWLEENVDDAEVTVDQLATYLGMGRTSMYNKIKGLTGKSPVELIQEFRMEKATYYLKSGQYSVSETSYKVGFSDPGYFSRSFKKHFGMSPADYIKSNKK